MINALWDELAGRAKVVLSDEQHGRLERYLELVREANRVMNLTRILDPEAMRLQHVGDALTLLPYLPPTPHRGADVGSGAGVPGLPLAIARPDVHVTLIEATKKKANFLRQTAAALGLTNVAVLDSRAEDAGLGPQREAFDVVIARAVATLDWLAEWCLPLTRKGGYVLAMKGARVNEELPAATNAIKQLGGGEAVVHPVELPGSEHRVIVQIPKVAKTDKRLPRPATVAKGRPLGQGR